MSINALLIDFDNENMKTEPYDLTPLTVNETRNFALTVKHAVARYGLLRLWVQMG